MATLLSKNKGQVLLFVFIMLILTSILVTGIANLWESGLQLNRSQLESLVAFYAAQSGLQRVTDDIFNIGLDPDTYPGCSGQVGLGTYVVPAPATITGGGGPKRKKFTSIGTCGSSTRRVSFYTPEHIPPGHAYGFWRNFVDSWSED